jgi:hypothetical protein
MNAGLLYKKSPYDFKTELPTLLYRAGNALVTAHFLLALWAPFEGISKRWLWLSLVSLLWGVACLQPRLDPQKQSMKGERLARILKGPFLDDNALHNEWRISAYLWTLRFHIMGMALGMGLGR